MCELKWNKRDSFQQKNTNLLQYAIQLVCILKWNKRGSFQKNLIDDSFVSKKIKRGNLLQYAIQLVCVLKWNKRVSFQKTTIYYCMLFNLCAYWNETRGTVFKKKHKFITVCYSTCVRIEMKQEGQFSTKKTQIYYSMLFNLCAYWNETRGVVFKKIQLMTISCWTCERKETRGAVFKKQQLYYSMLFNSCAYWNETRGQFSKKSNWWQYATELVWNETRGAVYKKTTIYYCMLFNLCAYWNETRGTVFKKIHKRIYYSMLFNLCANWNETRGTVLKKKTNLLQYAIQQEGQFSKHNIILQYAIQLVCLLKWNKRVSFQQNKTQIYY